MEVGASAGAAVSLGATAALSCLKSACRSPPAAAGLLRSFKLTHAHTHAHAHTCTHARVHATPPPSEYNKGLAFSDGERDRLYLRGLLPPVTLSQEVQLERTVLNLRNKASDLDKFTYMQSLQVRPALILDRIGQIHTWQDQGTVFLLGMTVPTAFTVLIQQFGQPCLFLCVCCLVQQGVAPGQVYVQGLQVRPALHPIHIMSTPVCSTPVCRTISSCSTG